MSYVHFGLLCEGSTDRAALPPLVDKALCYLRSVEAPRACFQWGIDEHAGKSTNENLVAAAQSGEYDVVLAHRDGAGTGQQIRANIAALDAALCPVIPVRELEAWLIVDPAAVRKATNASAKVSLSTPKNPEKVRDPKATLGSFVEACLKRKLSGRDGEVEEWFALIAEHVRLDRLQGLSWYQTFIADLRSALAKMGWPFA